MSEKYFEVTLKLLQSHIKADMLNQSSLNLKTKKKKKKTQKKKQTIKKDQS